MSPRKKKAPIPALSLRTYVPPRQVDTRARTSTLHHHLPARTPLPTSTTLTEIVPKYHEDWAIILRDEPRGQLVLYNPRSNTVSIRRTNAPASISPPADTETSSPGICVFCHRPFETLPNRTTTPPMSTFMDRNYFRLLASSNNSEVPSAAATPTGSYSQFSFPDAPTTHNIPSNRSFTSSGAAEDAVPLSHEHVSVKSFNQGYYERFFIEEKKLGRGFRGSVFRCQHVLDEIPLGDYAIKKVAVGDNHAWLVRMLREVHLLEKLHHVNIIDYKHAWLEHHRLTKFGPEVPCLFILMECANGGNLEEYIKDERSSTQHEVPEITPPLSAKERVLRERRKQKSDDKTAISLNNDINTPSSKRLENSISPHDVPNIASPQSGENSSVRTLSTNHIWSFFLDICDGLAHLHRHGIVHRDLKPPNLLLSFKDIAEKNEIPRILISDFGECEILSQSTMRNRTGATGTLEFMAPELIKVDASGQYLADFSPKADMWSLGVLLYYLCYSKLPYSQIDDVEILKHEILEFNGVQFPPDNSHQEQEHGTQRVPEELKKLIEVLMNPKASARPSAEQILQTFGHARSKNREAEVPLQFTSTRTKPKATPRKASFADAFDPNNDNPSVKLSTTHPEIGDMTTVTTIVPRSRRISSPASATAMPEHWHVEPNDFRSDYEYGRTDTDSGDALENDARGDGSAATTIQGDTRSVVDVYQNIENDYLTPDVPLVNNPTYVKSRKPPRARRTVKMRKPGWRQGTPMGASTFGTGSMTDASTGDESQVCAATDDRSSQPSASESKDVPSSQNTWEDPPTNPWIDWPSSASSSSSGLASDTKGTEFGLALIKSKRKYQSTGRRTRRRLLPGCLTESRNPTPALPTIVPSRIKLRQSLGIAIAICKIASCSAPCRPYAPAPAVLYPVVLLALVDLTTSDLFCTVLLTVLHVAFLAIVNKQGHLCTNTAW